jgi:hypothetical protein
MPTPTGIHYDLAAAPSTAFQDGPLVYAFDPITKSKFYTQTMLQNANDWQPLAFGTVGLPTYYLVEESIPTDAGGGIVSWLRTYSKIPSARTEFEAVAYNYNTRYVYDPEHSIWVLFTGGLVSFSTTVSSMVNFTYYKTDDPKEDIPIDKGWKLFVLNEVYLHQGTNPFVDLNNVPAYFLGDDSAITRWRGNIWQKSNRMVPVPALTVGV